MFGLSRKLFGLDISDLSIEVLLLSGSMLDSKLLAMGRMEIEPGIVENGKILKREKLAELILQLINNPQFGSIKTKQCIFSLPESKVFLHFFQIAKNLKQKERLKEIEKEAQENFPYQLGQLYWDFEIADIKDKEYESIVLAACPKDIVNNFLETLKICKISPQVLEPESLSLARALIQEKNKIILIADIGSRTTNLSLFEENKLRFSFLSDVAGLSFTNVISKSFKISLQEAEKLKITSGLNPNDKEGKIFLVLQQEMRKLISEILKIESYFKDKTGKILDKIILAGGSVQMPFLQEYLVDNLQKEVEIGDPWVKMNIDVLKRKEYLKSALEVNPMVFVNVVGLSLRGLERDSKEAGINLLKNIK